MDRILNVTNIKNYDRQIYDSGIVKFNDFVNNTYDIIHEKLYNAALEEFVKDMASKEEPAVTPEEYKRTHTLIEFKDDEYYKPSTVLVISKKRPYTKQTYYLLDYWNTYYYKSKKFLSNILESNGDDLYYEITHIDYIRGIITLESKITGDIIETTFDKLNKYTLLSEELRLDNCTFGANI